MPPQQSSVRALDRGLDILECLQASSGPLSLSELAERVTLSPSTAVRILSTLEKRSFIQRDARTKLYSLGPRSRTLQDTTSLMEILLAMSAAPMAVLGGTFGESISLFVPQGDRRICIKRLESPHPLRPVVNKGDSLPLSMGAGGKVLSAWLAQQGDLDPSAFIPPIPREALQQVRENGFAASFGEREAGTFAISAPVFAPTGRILAALALAGPLVRFEASKLEPMSEAVKTQADAISRAIGWEGGPAGT